MIRCIICFITFLNKAKANRRVLDDGLPTFCPNCKKVNVNQRFTMQDALGDPANVSKALTATLAPRLHKVPPDYMADVYRKIVDSNMRNRRTPSYTECYFEYTQDDILHAHLWVVARKPIVANMCAAMRRLGHVLNKECFDSEKWLEYCRKDQCDHTPLCHISCT